MSAKRRGNDVNDLGLRKSAVFLMALGPAVGGKVLAELPEPLVEELTRVIASLGHVTPRERKLALGDFVHTTSRISGVPFGGEETAKRLLEAGFGPRKAAALVGRVMSYSGIKNFEYLKNVDPLAIANYLKNEHPQTTAAVLAHMDPRQSSLILVKLPATLRGDVAHRMAVLEASNTATIDTVEDVLANQFQGEVSTGAKPYGGRQQVADVLNEIDRQAWTEILDEMREIDDDVANEVSGLMFVFEDIVLLDGADIQEILKEINGRELTLALKGATREVEDKIFGNMSRRAARSIAEDMDYLGPVRRAEVEDAQRRIVEVARILEEAGTISLGRGSKDAGVVT